MVRFEGQADIAMFVSPYGPSVQILSMEEPELMDEFAAMFKELGLLRPRFVMTPHLFVECFRMLIGTLPSPEQSRAFVADQDPVKRQKLIDSLLGLTGITTSIDTTISMPLSGL